MPPEPIGSETLERNLWIVFAGLFSVMVATAYLPIEPFVGVVPLWATVAIAAMLASALAAAIAGAVYGWPDTV